MLATYSDRNRLLFAPPVSKPVVSPTASDTTPAKAMSIAGYGSLGSQVFDPGWGVLLRFVPDAYTRALARKPDARLLVGHDTSLLLCRCSAGNLQVGQDSKGLWLRAQLPDIQLARDQFVLIKSRILTGLSIGFKILDSEILVENKKSILEVRDLELNEISLVAFPAQESTTVNPSTGLAKSAPTLSSNRPNVASLRRRLKMLEN